MSGRRPTSPELSILLAIGQVGTEMVVPIVLGLLIDWGCKTSPIFAVLGAIGGFVGGIIHLLILVRKLDRSDPPTG